MSVDRLAASLLLIATEDLAAVRLLAPTNNRNAVYLLEQAAEKIIRAVLTPVVRTDARDFPEPWQPTAVAVERCWCACSG